MDAVPRLHPETGLQKVGGRLLAAGPPDALHTFANDAEDSPVGERIVELADGRRTVAQIVEQLCAEFEVEPAVCARETRDFVNLLVERQVLVLG